MPWIDGPFLAWSQRRQVREAFPYRWTVENEEQSRRLHAAAGCTPPTRVPEVTDRAWIDAREFMMRPPTPARKGRGKLRKGARPEIPGGLSSAPRCKMLSQPEGLGVFTLENERDARGPGAGSET